MTPRPALVIAGTRAIPVGPMTIAERAVLVAHRVGLAPIRLWSPVSHVSAQVTTRGIPVSADPTGIGPFSTLDPTRPTIVIGPDVLVDSLTLIAISAQAARDNEVQSIVVRDRGLPAVLFVSIASAPLIGACTSLAAAADELAARGMLRELTLPHFCRHVPEPTAVARLEHELIRHLNGGTHESFFTKIIRRFSVPISIRLARLGARPTHVTLAGLVLAVLSAWCVSQGSYLAGLAGAGLYYFSMVFDCSDGEVARLTVRDSAFGAWLETAVDYTTYVLLLGALTIAVRDEPGNRVFMAAALVAAVGSVLVAAVATYLRGRVAAADPGQFDDSSANALKSAGRLHRFARWGRQWIKRSTIAHLVLVLALVNQLKLLLLLWAFGAALASVVIIAVTPFVVRRVAVTQLTVRGVDTR